MIIMITCIFGLVKILDIHSVSPDFGTVVSMHNDSSGYYIRYSSEDALWYAKVDYAAYITCKPGMYWQGQPSEVCTITP